MEFIRTDTMKNLLSFLLMASLLHTTTSTVYYVMPDDHYHPINDNTYTLQHYLNNINKYFTSNSQLHFLPGQYYLNNDLIIQNVSNFSLIGNRTNEVINTVINCTSPAGIVVVGSSNIVIANIVMNECGNQYIIFLKQSAFITDGLASVYTLDCTYINYTYVHSLCHQLPCGFQFVDAFKQTVLINLISSFITVRNDNLTTNTEHMLNITGFQAYNVMDYIHIKIEQFYTTSDFTATIQGVNFMNKWNLLMIHIGCSGHNIINVRDCTFTNKHHNSTFYYNNTFYYNDDYDDNYNDDYDDKEDEDNNYKKYYYFNVSENTVLHNYNNLYKFNGISMIYGYYEDCIGTKPNKIYLCNCHIADSTENVNLVYFVLESDGYKEVKNLTRLSVFMSSCVFVNIGNARNILSAKSFNDDQDYYILRIL